MANRRRKQLRLSDLVRAVSQFSRNDLEASLAVVDLLNRGVVRVRAHGQAYRIIVR